MRAKRETANRITVKPVAAKVREFVLVDLPVTLLSGEEKALRFCFGAELGQLGAAFGRIDERVGPTNMAGECLTEAEAGGC